MSDRYDVNEARSPIYYEISQFVATHSPLGPEYAPWLRNAVLESKLVHARLLLDFFDDPRAKFAHDDILEKHFFDGPPEKRNVNRPDDVTRRKRLVPDEIRRRLNKDLAHLTYDRLMRKDPDRRQYPFDTFRLLATKCAEFILKLLGDEFQIKLKPEARKPWETLQADLKALVGQMDESRPNSDGLQSTRSTR